MLAMLAAPLSSEFWLVSESSAQDIRNLKSLLQLLPLGETMEWLEKVNLIRMAFFTAYIRGFVDPDLIAAIFCSGVAMEAACIYLFVGRFELVQAGLPSTPGTPRRNTAF